MDAGILKAIALFLPIVVFLVWQIVRLERDPELRNDGGDDADSGQPRHSERE